MLKRFTNLKLFSGQQSAVAGTKHAIDDVWVDDLWVDGQGLVCSPAPQSPHEVIDLQGQVVLPTFADRHAHPVLAGRELLSADITQAKSISEIITTLKAHLKAEPGTEALVAGAYDRDLAGDGRFLAAWLDEVSPELPIVLHANDHHTIWVNTAALKLAGLLKPDGSLGEVPNLEFGSIDVDEQGRPSGVLREDQAKQLVLSRSVKPTRAENLNALLAAQNHLLALGITKVCDAYVDSDIAAAYLDALDAEELVIDFDLLVAIKPKSHLSEIDEALNLRARFGQLGKSRAQHVNSIQARPQESQVRVTGIKMFADGVLGSSTAAVRESYLNPDGEANGNHGDLMWSDGELAEALSAAAATALDVHIHAIGDAAIEQIIRVIKPKGAKITIAHAELAAVDQLARLAQAGIRVNFQPLWARPDAMMRSCAAALGSQRVEALYRHRSAIDAGLEIEFGSDWPVSDANPLLGLFTAAFRKLPGSSEVHNPGEAITLAEALAAYKSTSLELGSPADFCTIDQDVTSNNELFAIAKVTQTFIGGQPKLTRQ